MFGDNWTKIRYERVFSAVQGKAGTLLIYL